MSAALSERFENALIYATRLHAQQKRNGTAIPYVSHLLAVASLVMVNGDPERRSAYDRIAGTRVVHRRHL